MNHCICILYESNPPMNMTVKQTVGCDKCVEKYKIEINLKTVKRFLHFNEQ